jgi:hypothetical protein
MVAIGLIPAADADAADAGPGDDYVLLTTKALNWI